MTTTGGTPLPEQLAAAHQAVSYHQGQVYPAVFSSADVDGPGVQTALDSRTGWVAVQFHLQSPGTLRLRDFTATHSGQYMPIIVDKQVIASPLIQATIADGNPVINVPSGTVAQRRAVELRHGALPVALTIVARNPIP